MTMNRMLLIFCLCLASCSSDDKSADTSDPLSMGRDDTAVEEDEPCVLSVRVDATLVDDLPDPVVGDSWYLLMYSDETLLLGASVLRIEPSHLGTLDDEDPIITFAAAGDGEIRYQVGNRQVNTPVTIRE